MKQSFNKNRSKNTGATMFENKEVLVTGASRGIGQAIADGFLDAGAEVSILASSDDVHRAADELSEKHGKNVRAIQCDISSMEAVDDALADTKSIDVLINNAGLELETPIDDLSDETADRFRRIIEINVLGTYYVTRSCVNKMTRGGRILITSSIWGKTAVAGFSAYCTSKHANLGFMRSLAWELAPKGITVNAVCPGWVKTGAAMKSLEVMSDSSQASAAEELAKITSRQAIDGLLEPQDVVAPYLFLASDAAADITGQALNIDRGEVMY